MSTDVLIQSLQAALVAAGHDADCPVVHGASADCVQGTCLRFVQLSEERPSLPPIWLRRMIEELPELAAFIRVELGPIGWEHTVLTWATRLKEYTAVRDADSLRPPDGCPECGGLAAHWGNCRRGADSVVAPEETQNE